MRDTDPDLFRRAAIAAYENAEDLLGDAQHLYDDGRFARAMSLAILGKEELGKCLLFTLTATGQVEILSDQWKDRITWHEVKQVVSEAAADAFALVEDYFATIGEEAPHPARFSPADWSEELVEQTAEWVSGFIRRPSKARGEYRRRAEQMRETRREAGLPEDEPAPPRTPEETKWAGLYIEIDDGEVQTPRDVGEREAWTEIIGLRGELGSAGWLLQCLEDDEEWMDLLDRFTDGPDEGAEVVR